MKDINYGKLDTTKVVRLKDLISFLGGFEGKITESIARKHAGLFRDEYLAFIETNEKELVEKGILTPQAIKNYK